MKSVAQEQHRHGGHRRDRSKRRVDAHHEEERDDEGGPELDQEDEPERDEATDRVDVADRARQQLAGLPLVVEADVQRLQVRVEIVADVPLHPKTADVDELAAAEGEGELGCGQAHQQRRQERQL